MEPVAWKTTPELPYASVTALRIRTMRSTDRVTPCSVTSPVICPAPRCGLDVDRDGRGDQVVGGSERALYRPETCTDAADDKMLGSGTDQGVHCVDGECAGRRDEDVVHAAAAFHVESRHLALLTSGARGSAQVAQDTRRYTCGGPMESTPTRQLLQPQTATAAARLSVSRSTTTRSSNQLIFKPEIGVCPGCSVRLAVPATDVGDAARRRDVRVARPRLRSCCGLTTGL
jgi:hypothetical protein